MAEALLTQLTQRDSHAEVILTGSGVAPTGSPSCDCYIAIWLQSHQRGEPVVGLLATRLPSSGKHC